MNEGVNMFESIIMDNVITKMYHVYVVLGHHISGQTLYMGMQKQDIGYIYVVKLTYLCSFFKISVLYFSYLQQRKHK